MAGQQRKIEGDENQKRKAAREAKAQGKRPSEMGATTGASKQLEQTRGKASHQEKLDTKREGKARNAGTSGKPRPGNREQDPKRAGRWG